MSLRDEILRRRLQNVIPRVYSGQEQDVVAGLLDRIVELTTPPDTPGFELTRDDDDDDDEPQDPTLTEKARLADLAAWIRQETSDGQPIHRHPEILHVVEELAKNPDFPLPETRRAVNVPEGPRSDHRMRDFPFGFRWCVTCGAVWRSGEVHRYFEPGTGEVSELPPCPGPRGPKENPTP